MQIPAFLFSEDARREIDEYGAARACIQLSEGQKEDIQALASLHASYTPEAEEFGIAVAVGQCWMLEYVNLNATPYLNLFRLLDFIGAKLTSIEAGVDFLTKAIDEFPFYEQGRRAEYELRIANLQQFIADPRWESELSLALALEIGEIG